MTLFQVFALLHLSFAQNTGETQLPRAARELIYQAEVFGRVESSLASLREMLRGASSATKHDIARAMGVVKLSKGWNRTAQSGVRLKSLERPQALLHHRNDGYFMAQGAWFELGDWIEEYFVLEITMERILLESREGYQRPLFPKQISEIQQLQEEEDVAVFHEAPLGDVLSFLSQKAGLNSFLPSDIDRKVSGTFQIPDWLTAMDRLCQSHRLTWTRRRDNVIFRLDQHFHASQAGMIESFEGKGENLGSFLHNLATSFGMELVLDEKVADQTVDIKLVDQPWDEVLDCLAIGNGFTWNLVETPGEKAKLFIQIE